MNWCQPHWDLLRQAIIDRGLDGLGTQTGKEATEQMQAELDGDDETFDPLMGSYWRINTKMTESLVSLGRGQEVLELKCPLCILVEDGQPETVKDWIDGVTDSAKIYAIEQGLVKAS